ncbi:MAG: repair protein SbcD/Mre11 [Actinomycetota bacterium]|jgi:exonuclease SbcD|nr:repair protein SbcD/Mre11 [Actinomycetota bacterium]
MRLLHTADWHVGKAIGGRSRADEHEAVLAEIADIARREKVDVSIVAGDLFDTAAPSPESERIVYRSLLELARHAPVVVVPGNHDSDRRLAAIAPLLDLAEVNVRCFVERDSIELTTQTGEALRLALIPWLSQRYIVKAAELMAKDAGDLTGQFSSRMRSIVTALTEGFSADAVNVVVGHMTIAGGELGGGERTAQTIFDYWVDPTIFPNTAHYVALGHLHKAQQMAGPCPIHYCGSPMQLDFSDKQEAKGVLVVDATPGAPATVRTVPIASGRKLRTLAGTIAELTSMVGTADDAYLRILVNESARVGLGDEVRELFPSAVKVIIDHDDPKVVKPGRSDRATTSPHDLFTEYLAERDIDDPRLVALFDELYEEAHAPHPA